MNNSFKQTGDFPLIAEWFRKQPFPHCKNVNSLSCLRSGIAIAEILCDKLPESYHHFFLPKIQIFNMNSQRSILNLKILLSSLQKFCQDNPQEQISINEFTAQGIYFDHNMMENFLFTVIIPLKKYQNMSVYRQKLIQNAHCHEELSDIANLSSIVANGEPKILIHAEKNKKIAEEEQKVSNEELFCQEIRISKICKWLEEHHHISIEDSSPEEIMGRVVNTTFSGSRLDKQNIVKPSHYVLGSAFVFKKIGDYLLQCDRMPKKNVLSMLEEVQFGCIREQVFWNIIQDIMNIKINHVKKLNKSCSTKKKIEKVQSFRNLTPSNKQNIENCNNKEYEIIKKNKYAQYDCTPQTLRICQRWIARDLGYEFSLTRSKKTIKIQQNPLLNGVLLGSIIMRMQLGKVNINKQPKSKCQIKKNMNQVANCILQRGLEAGRKFSKVKPSYQAYIGIIWEVKQQLERKKSIEKNRRAEINKEKITLKISEIQKKEIVEWLQQKGFMFECLNSPVEFISDICGQILQLKLLRQTTNKIKQNNMSKIVSQLRRLGWQGIADSKIILEPQSAQYRWSMLEFMKSLCQNKIFYAH